MRYFLSAAVVCLLLASCSKEDLSVYIDGEPTDGTIYVAPFKNNSGVGELLVLDKYGQTLFSRATPTSAWNFQRWDVNGKVRYTYLEANTSGYQISPQSIIPSYAVVLDENFTEIKRFGLEPLAGYAGQSSVDSHEFVYLDDNHFITIGYIEKPVTNIPLYLNPVAGCKVVAPVIQEVQNDEVVFQWDGTNYPEFYSTSVEGNVFSNASVVHDYMHINSVFVDPRDNNLICSFRNANQVVKLNRTSGNIMWRLGGSNSDFPISAQMKFLRQHHATITSSHTVLIFDNGHETERPTTRIVEFGLDEVNHSISLFTATEVPNTFAQYMGSVQKRGDTYFIGCGSAPKVLELNYVTGAINFTLNLPNPSYRAYKF